MLGSGPRDQSSESPRCGMAGQSRIVGDEQDGVFARSANQLLDGLRAVKKTGGGFGDDGKTALAVRHNYVALIVHGRVEFQLMPREKFFCGGRACEFQPDERAFMFGQSDIATL